MLRFLEGRNEGLAVARAGFVLEREGGHRLDRAEGVERSQTKQVKGGTKFRMVDGTRTQPLRTQDCRHGEGQRVIRAQRLAPNLLGRVGVGLLVLLVLERDDLQLDIA